MSPNLVLLWIASLKLGCTLLVVSVLLNPVGKKKIIRENLRLRVGMNVGCMQTIADCKVVEMCTLFISVKGRRYVGFIKYLFLSTFNIHVIVVLV